MNVTSIAFQSCFLIAAIFICWKLAVIANKDEKSLAEYAFLAACNKVSMVPLEVAGNVVGLICEFLPNGRRGVKPIEEIRSSAERFVKAEKITARFSLVPFGEYDPPDKKQKFYEGASFLWR